MIPIKNPALRSLLNFLMLPAAIALCWLAAWFLAVYPTQQGTNITLAMSLLALVKFWWMFYWSSLAVSLGWIIYMSLSFKTFMDNLFFFRINLVVLIVSTCLLTFVAVYYIR
jgi:hypothetical protein